MVKPLLGVVKSQVPALASIQDEDVDVETFLDDDRIEEKKEAEEVKRHTYDPFYPNPLWAQAKTEPIWEMYALRNHVHPWVSEAAANLLSGKLTFSNSTIDDRVFEIFAENDLLENFVKSSRAKLDTTHTKPTKFSMSPKVRKAQKPKREAYTTEALLKAQKVPPHERYIQKYYADSELARRMRERQKLRAGSNKDADVEDIDEENAGQAPSDDDEDADAWFDRQGDSDDGEDGEEEAFAGDDGDDDSVGGEGAGEAAESGFEEGGDDFDDDEEASLGTKRKASAADDLATRFSQAKKKSKTSGSIFASAEDFDEFLD